ncbi:MAG: M20 family metallopeptidase [Burkholderiaceae bacterium]|nr:M20 family metallopeptidase [Burkholderiaceae bacterium]
MRTPIALEARGEAAVQAPAGPPARRCEAVDSRSHGSQRVLETITAWHGELASIRQALHANPELGFEEHFTAELVCRQLQRAGVDEIHRNIGCTGLVGVVRGRHTRSSRTVGLRADMDALPIQEDGEHAHRSRKAGVMHGCGHDGHVAMLVGAARYLAASRDFDGTVHLIFQPGEEGHGGAKAMIDEGLFERFPCDAVYAMHNWPALPPGTIAVRPGPIMAAADRITITIEGRGGHGAHPYLTVDPVLVAAHIVTAAQSIVSRNVSPIDSAVVSLCSIQAGHPGAMSVIPHEAKLVGTVRTFREATQAMVEQRLRALVESVATGFGAKASLVYDRVYPATINSTREAMFGAAVADELVGAANVVRELDPSMGAEDFSFMLRARPGAYFRLGQGGAAEGCLLHSSRYDFNDAVLPVGAALFARLAERSMPIA